MRDVDYAPDDEYFAVATTGGPYYGHVVRHSHPLGSGGSGAALIETWADWSGGDTLTAVAVTDVAVYIGGHQRWMNNHSGATSAGIGAVSREGIAPSTPSMGCRLPGIRAKTAGWRCTTSILPDLGLYVGSDTDFTVGSITPSWRSSPWRAVRRCRSRLRRPPTNLYSGDAATPSRCGPSTDHVRHRETVVGNVPITETCWADLSTRPARCTNRRDRRPARRARSTATTWGSVGNEPSWTSGRTSARSAGWIDGRLYYTDSRGDELRYRYFSLESGLVGSQTFTASGGINWSSVNGVSFVDNVMYYSSTDGNLRRVTMVNGTPDAGSVVLVSGPGVDGEDWSNVKALWFLSLDGAPTVSLSGPVGGSLVSGVVPVSAVASDDDGVVGVEFFVGGVSLGVDADGSDGWGVSWDSAAGSDGGVTVSAVATDSGGNTASDSVSVTVDNEGPSVSVSAPIDGATVSGVVAVAASASDTVGVAQVEFFADGVSLGVDADGSDGWGVSWNTNASPAGVVSLSATATDLSGATDSDTISVTIDTSGGGVVVLVVGNPAALSSGDVAVVARFEALGSVVTLVDDNDATAGSATGADVVVVSSTANSNLLKTAFKSVAIPVWVSKPYLLDDMGMTGTSAGTDYGTVSASQVTITDPAHPLAAGLSGTVTITPAARLMQFGVPGGDGVTVATVAGTPTTFLYEAGQQLADGTTAAGCRVAFSIFQTAPASFTTDAWALFDAAATYTLNGCVPVVSNDPPTVTITGPADGATVSGTTSVSADAADTDGVSKVEFFADGASLGVDTDAGDGWSIDWDTTTSPAGPVSLSATATDTLGATGTDTIAVTVDHGAPTVTVTAPADGSTVSGATTVSADAADPDGVTQVEFFVDGTSIGVDTDAGDGWSVSWDTTATGDGVAVSVTAAATDTLGAQGSNGVTVTVDNDGPTVTITAPADGSTVIGATAVSADASDTVGISQVEFFVDGTPIGVDTTSGDGWTVSWDTTTSGDGPVAVSATATDTGGRTATDAITVTVDNTTNGLVVIVVGNPAALSTGDTAIVTRLEASGYLVTALDDDGLTTTSADGANLVIISSTSNSNKIGTVFNGLTQTVWDAKTWHFDDLGLTGTGANSDYGNTATETITITNPTHPLAAGLTGTIGFTTIRRTVSWGQPGPDADIIATANTNPTIFIYQTGDTLANGTTTPGCRITFPIFGDGPTYYTTQAWTLFDATTTHATNGCPTEAGDAPPTATLTAPADGATISGIESVSATASDDQGVAQVEFFADGTSIGLDTDGTDGWSTDWDSTTSADGSVTVSLTATDTIGQTATDSVTATIDNGAGTEDFAILITIDGLLTDTVTTLGATELPSIYRLIDEGASTSNARTVVESTQTLPNHTSMLTSAPVSGTSGHGVTFNEDDGLTVHDSAGRYVASMFDVAHDNGLSTLLYAGKPKFDFLDRSWDATNGAADTTGADNGTDKIDHYMRSDGATVTSSFLAQLAADPTNLNVVHYAGTDAAGHDFGWGSAEYDQALKDIDALVGQILAFVETDPTMAGRTVVVLSTDHGGTGTSHIDETLAVNYTIPMYVWGVDIAGGGDLYALTGASRLDPGTAQPDYLAAGQPIRNAGTGNLLLDLLGLGPIPGSAINSAQDLDITTPGA